MHIEKVPLEGKNKSYKLHMASGETIEVTIKPGIRTNFWDEYERPSKNPYYMWTCRAILEHRIANGIVATGINYALVESFDETESEEKVLYVYKVTQVIERWFWKDTVEVTWQKTLEDK